MIIDILDYDEPQTRLEDMIEVVISEWTNDDDISEYYSTDMFATTQPVTSELAVTYYFNVDDIGNTCFWFN